MTLSVHENYSSVAVLNEIWYKITGVMQQQYDSFYFQYCSILTHKHFMPCFSGCGIIWLTYIVLFLSTDLQ